MRKEEMRVLSAHTSALSNTMPITPLKLESSPINKKKSVDYGVRGRSIYKPERLSLESQEELSAYSELKNLYEKALTENCFLKNDLHENSISTVKLEKDFSFKTSYAKEIEELHEILSNTFESIQTLQNYKKELVANKLQAKKELEDQKTMHNFAKDNMVSLLQGKLNSTVDILKSIYRDKKNLESLLEKEEKSKNLLQGQSAALDEKIKVLENRNKDLLNVANLTTHISAVAIKQDAVNKKIEKYEAYIQSKMKKS